MNTINLQADCGMSEAEQLKLRISLLEKQQEELRWRYIFLENEWRRSGSDQDTYVEPTYLLLDPKTLKKIRFAHVENRYWLHFGDVLAFIGKSRAQASYYGKEMLGFGTRKILVECGKGISWTYFANYTFLSAYTERKIFDASPVLCLFEDFGRVCKMSRFERVQ